jgi:hypothetical protein
VTGTAANLLAGVGASDGTRRPHTWLRGGGPEAIGREKFLAKYGFGFARSYFIEWNGEHYDSKAIAGAAHGYIPGQTALNGFRVLRW